MGGLVGIGLEAKGTGLFLGSVTEKDLISFAALKGRGNARRLNGAKAMRSPGELNRNGKLGYGD